MNNSILKIMNDTFLAKITKYFIRKFLRSSYPRAHHSYAIMIMQQAILDEQHESFREDNEPTAIAFIVEQLVLVSDLKEDWPMYLKLMELVGPEKPEFYRKRCIEIKERSLKNAIHTQEIKQKAYDHAVKSFETQEQST